MIEKGLFLFASLFIWRNYWKMHEHFGFTKRARLMNDFERAHAECETIIHGASNG
jgi:hypothetical protein